MRVFEAFHGGVLTWVYYRLTGATPDFEVLAKNTDADDQASEAEKSKALADEIDTMRGIFNEIDRDVRLVWRGMVRLARAGHVAGRFQIDGLAEGLGEPLDGYEGARPLSQWPKFGVPVLVERLSLSDETGESLRREAR